jgi:cytochrome c553
LPRVARLVLCVLFGALSAGVLGGCLGESDSDKGEKVFLDAGCGNCHTMAAAGTSGKRGPNLDRLRPDTSAVVRQVTNGGNGMPAFADKLSSDEIFQLASYVKDATANASVTGTAAFKPDDTKLAECERTQSWPCYEQAFGNITYNDGPQRSLKLLQARMDAVQAVRTNCHRIAHAMGGAGLALLKTPGRAFAAGNATCWSGYYHGVLEKGFAGVEDDDLNEKARDLCSEGSLRRDLFLTYQCVHGLGHGLMIHTGYDLPRALGTCDALQSDWDQRSCSGGVFMENFTTFYQVQSRWLKANDYLYPCNAVKERHKYFCYYLVTSRILRLVNWEWETVAAVCRRAEANWVGTCFESFGRDVSGFVQDDPRGAIKLCRLAREHLSDCIYAVSRDIVNQDGGRFSRATRFCDQSPNRISRAQCYRGIGTTVAVLANNPRQRGVLCERLTRSPRDAGSCKGGAQFATPDTTPSTGGRNLG